jgi:hypothetical protein
MKLDILVKISIICCGNCPNIQLIIYTCPIPHSPIPPGCERSEHKSNKARLIQLLQEKFRAVDFDRASQDVRPFIKDRQELALWSQDFFLEIIKSIAVI